MLPPVNGQTQGYLDDLNRIQTVLTTVQRQITSGIRVGVASDDPSAVPAIFRSQSEIAMNQQAQTNLNQVKAELDSGDSALQQASKLMDQAVTLGAQAASLNPGDTRYASLLKQAQSIQESLVSISSTTVNGRYIFSGDLDGQALYTVDASQPNGVRQTASATSTAAVTDSAGNTLWLPKTATEIFDAADPASSVFGALGKLVTALSSQDSQAAQDAVSNVKTASDYLNQQLGLVGIGETRVTDALNALSSSIVAEKQQLSVTRDTDVASAAIQLSQANLQQQSAMQVGTRIAQQHTLFDYLA